MQCTKCNKSLRDVDHVKYAKCQGKWHTNCTSLSGCSVDSLKKKFNSWLCTTCNATKLGLINPALSSSSVTGSTSKIDDILAAVNEIKISLSRHEHFFGKVNKKIDEVSNQLRDLGTRTTSLEDRVNLIETRLSNLESTNILTDNNIISEVSDRQFRSRNVIIFNAPESDNNTLANESSFVKSVLDSLSIVMTPTAISRLGRKSTKPRPLKITLQEASDVFVILKNKHKLRSSQNYSSIRISPDRTQMQRDQLRNVYAKLEERKAAGETDLVVKFLKGIPTISKN